MGIVNEMSQLQKNKNSVILLIRGNKNSQIHGIKKENWDSQQRVEGKRKTGSC